MEQSTFYRKLLENLYDGVYYVDRDRVVTYWNKAAERISGYSSEEVIGKSCADNILRHVDEHGVELCINGCPLTATIGDGQIREADVFMHHKDGHRVPVCVRGAPIFNDSGEITGAVEVFSNNTKNAHALETIKKLQSEAMQDPLTELGNRRFADLNIDNLVTGATEHGVDFGLLFMDVDHFKVVNDTWGHSVGDRVLSMVAKTIAHGVRPLDIPCRWGGEEFVILLPNINSQALAVVGERLRMLIENSWIEHQGETIRVTASFGGTISGPEDTPATIVSRADAMVYKSKEAGRNRLYTTD
ncbi:MAG: diguanylate cyclase [Desulfovibrio sp.]|nr:MAG: diguanylate cyclase [Desulfovibrio sp.]